MFWTTSIVRTIAETSVTDLYSLGVGESEWLRLLLVLLLLLSPEEDDFDPLLTLSCEFLLEELTFLCGSLSIIVFSTSFVAMFDGSSGSVRSESGGATIFWTA